MDDRILLPMHNRRHAQQVLQTIDQLGLHDRRVNCIPQIVKTTDGYAIQVSRWDHRILQAWQDYCTNYAPEPS